MATKIKKGQIDSDIVSGWTPAGETWTYASATTITVPSGATNRYSKGDKIKLTQTTVKYFYVVGVVDTTLTITGGTSYTLANAAITDNFYSKVQTPQGFPDWFNYTPGLGGFTQGNGVLTGRFKIQGSSLTFNCSFKFGSTSGYPAGQMTFGSVPIACADPTGGGSADYRYPIGGHMHDSGSNLFTVGTGLTAGATTFTQIARGTGLINGNTIFTWANGDGIYLSGTYEY